MANEDVFSTLGNMAPSITPRMDLIVILFFLILFGILGFWFLRPKMYPVLVIIRKKVGGGFIHVQDDGKIILQDSTRQLYVHRINQYFPIPSTSKMLPTRGLFKRWAVRMYQDDNGDLVPEEFEDGEYVKKSTPHDQELHLWAQTQRKRVQDKYAVDFWGKYGVLVGEGLVAMTLIIVSLIIMDKHLEATEILSAALRETSTVLQAIRG